MPILTKLSGNSTSKKINKIGKRAAKMYPYLQWSIQLPSPEIEETYGKGFIIMARDPQLDKVAEYFVLFEDPRIDNWIHMIAIELDPQVTEE